MDDAKKPSDDHRKLVVGRILLDQRNEIERVCKPTRERALALTKIDEAMMWLANAEVA
jgi:hypothetical protein